MLVFEMTLEVDLGGLLPLLGVFSGVRLVPRNTNLSLLRDFTKFRNLPDRSWTAFRLEEYISSKSMAMVDRMASTKTISKMTSQFGNGNLC